MLDESGVEAQLSKVAEEGIGYDSGEFLEGLVSISGRLSIYQTTSLTTLEGLENLKSVGGDVFICENSSLEDLDALPAGAPDLHPAPAGVEDPLLPGHGVVEHHHVRRRPGPRSAARHPHPPPAADPPPPHLRPTSASSTPSTIDASSPSRFSSGVPVRTSTSRPRSSKPGM